MLALIGARAGSKRIPGKNLRILGDKPLVVWTLQAAFDSECFSHIVLSTESSEIAKVALDWLGKHLEVVMRPPHMAEDHSPDLDWIKHAITFVAWRSNKTYLNPPDIPVSEEIPEYCLLRPTSPFRGPETIQRAVSQWKDIRNKYDSLRAIRAVSEHPQKMWTSMFEDAELDECPDIVPWPSWGYWDQVNGQPWNQPTQQLARPIFVQTGALEIAWTKTPLEMNSISGDRVAGFIIEGPEAMDLNTEEDWSRAEAHIAKQTVS